MLVNNGSLLKNHTSVDILSEANIVVTALALCAFLMASMMLLFLLKYENKENNRFIDQVQLIIIVFTMITATIVPLSVSNDNYNLYSIYLMVVLAAVGIVLYIAGCALLFEVSETKKPLCNDHPDMSLIIWVVAIPLVLLELFETISATKYEHHDGYFAGVKSIGLLQKLALASFYHFSLRLRVPKENRRKISCWFLIIISMFNYAMWLDSIISAKKGVKYIEMAFGSGFSIVGSAFDALLIDYRLLCCLLFAEHALQIHSGEDNQEAGNQAIDTPMENSDESSLQSNVDLNSKAFHAQTTQISGFGYLFGFVCLSLQLICGLQYAGLTDYWVNIFPIIADVSVGCLGIWFIVMSVQSSDNDNTNWRENHSKAIDLLVTIMGVFGFLFWLIKTALTVKWCTMTDKFSSDRLYYLHWSASKNTFRTLGIVFQLYIFMKSDPLMGCRVKLRSNIWSFFLLPALMLSLLSVFTMTIIDSYNGIIEVLLEDSHLNVVFTTLLKAGEPIHLGFCLHVFLHFFIINKNMRDFTKDTEIQRIVSEKRRSKSSYRRRINSSVSGMNGNQQSEIQRMFRTYHGNSFRRDDLVIDQNDNPEGDSLTQRLITQ